MTGRHHEVDEGLLNSNVHTHYCATTTFPSTGPGILASFPCTLFVKQGRDPAHTPTGIHATSGYWQAISPGILVPKLQKTFQVLGQPLEVHPQVSCSCLHRGLAICKHPAQRGNILCMVRRGGEGVVEQGRWDGKEGKHSVHGHHQAGKELADLT